MEDKISKPLITLLKDGPIRISGSYVLSDENNQELEKGQEVYLCRCGKSNKKPYCDGSHKSVQLTEGSAKESCE